MRLPLIQTRQSLQLIPACSAVHVLVMTVIYSFDESLFYFGDAIVTMCDENSGNNRTNYVLRTVAAQTPCAYIVISNVLL